MSSVRIGMRIEFRDGEEYAGAVHCEDKYLAVAAPRPGEKIALAALTGVTVPKLPLELFLPVYSVEHYPCEVDAASGPGCIAVIRHAALPAGGPPGHRPGLRGARLEGQRPGRELAPSA